MHTMQLQQHEEYALTVLIHCAYVNLKLTAKLPIYLGFGGDNAKKE